MARGLRAAGPGAAAAADAAAGQDTDPDADPVALLALRAPSQAGFLAGDPVLVRLLETASERKLTVTLRARVLARLARELLAQPDTGPRRRALVDEAVAPARAGAAPGGAC